MSSSVEFVLLESIASVEDFLKLQFNASSTKIKKYFDRSFLNRSLAARSTLLLPLNFVNDNLVNPSYEGPDIEIVYQDELFFVLNKPANIHSHPLVYEEKNNCLSFLRTKFPEYLNVNQAHYDRGLLYRLDFETSGILVYVKKAESYKWLRDNFNQFAKKKIYHCIVQGHCQLQGRFQHYFYSKEAKGRRVVVSSDPSLGQCGEFLLTALSFDAKTQTTLMEVELKTGLRHQIRAQLAHLGYPIAGDIFYGAKAAKRLYLHAYLYQLIIDQKSFQFSIEPIEF